jgi:two-component system, cell cycle sensor histidine kinase and response regulator CckA
MGAIYRNWAKQSVVLLMLVFCAIGRLQGAESPGERGVLPSPPDSASRPARVLILNSYHPRYVWGDAVMRGVSEGILKGAPEAEVRCEYLDAKHYRPAVVFEPMRRLLLAKYKQTNVNFDVIVSTDDDALDFLALYRDDIFPGTPVVFCGTNTFEPGRLRGRQGFTGIVEDYDLRGTLELVLRLHPQARHWALVSGISTSSLMNQQRFYRLYPEYKDRVRMIDLARLNVPEMIAALQKLPEDAVVIYLSWYKMPDGTFLSVRESTSLVLQYAQRPMYSPWDYTMGYGVIGGHVLKAVEHGSDAARIALRILDGTPVSRIPIARHDRFTYLFDWRMLQKFGISIDALPEPHVFINEPDTLYYRYKKQLWLVTGVFVYLLVTILALIRTIFQRKAVEADLRLDESRLEALLELNQTGDLSLEAIVQMVLGKAVELTKSQMGFLVYLGDRQPVGQSCIANADDRIEFRDLGADTMAELGRMTFFKELIGRRAPLLIEAAGDLKQLKELCFPADPGPIRQFAVLPLMEAATVQVGVGVGNKPFLYDGKDFRQLRLLLEGMLALIRSRQAKEREERLEAQLRQAQKMEAIGTFAGGIAHDFNNIIGGISSCAELAMENLRPPDPVREDLHQVLKAANRGKSLVRRILTFSRRKNEQIAPTDLRQVVLESMALVRSLMPDNIHVVQELDDDPMMVMADATQIQQVVLNLCANAEQAIRGKNGILRVGLSVATIDPEEADLHPGLSPGGYVRMTVADSGEGIPADLQPRIFEPFFTTRSHLGGTGLGLSTSHGIVTRHGGIITVNSIPGQGAAFMVLLPLAAEALPGSTLDAAEEIRGGSERLLLVDDDEVMRYAMTRYLRRLGYTIRAFGNGKEALSAFRKNGSAGFDLVVTDQSMPHMTGTALVQRIRKLDACIPVILFSGFLSDDGLPPDPAPSDDLNIQCILGKPFTNKQLGQTVRRVLDQAASAGGRRLKEEA